MAPQVAAPGGEAAAFGTAWAYRLLGLSREEATRKSLKEAYNRCGAARTQRARLPQGQHE